MSKDKATLFAFFGALILIAIMLVSTIINLSKISNVRKEKQLNNSNSVQENKSIINYVSEDNIIIKNDENIDE